MPVVGEAQKPSRAEPRGLLFPETWPPIVRAFAVISVAMLIAYHGAFSAPFIFDDLPGIVHNTSIRSLWPLMPVLLPEPATETSVVSGPIVNFTFALNYAWGGLDVRGYHAVNLAIHIAASLLLFAVLRRTLQNDAGGALAAIKGARAESCALFAALLWALHPLQTESVTGVIRRTELLVGLFYLLTLYAFIRAAKTPRAWRWGALAVAASALGMATKEGMLTAPLIVMLYDRTFLAGSFGAAWRARRGLYAALMATWLVGVPFALRDGTGEFGAGTSIIEPRFIQCRAIALYIKLALWPDPLVLDYGIHADRHWGDVAPQASLVLVLGVATVVALIRRPMIGFLGAWFFLVLAPSCSVVPPGMQTIAEHRMYLPLAAIVVGVTVAALTCGRRWGVAAMLGLALVFSALTVRRNADYANPLAMWRDTVAKAPANPRAHFNLANALAATGHVREAIRNYEAALRLEPRHAAAHHNLAGALLQLDQPEEAVPHYEAALQIEPGSADTHANFASALLRLGRFAEAVAHYEQATRHGLLAAQEQLRFGRALAELGQFDAALGRLRESIRLDPKLGEARVVLGMVLSATGRGAEALKHFTEAVVLNPQDADAHAALADALVEANRPAEALTHYETARRLQPAPAAPLHTGRANALARLGRVAEAIFHYDEALRLNPDDAEARRNLASVRAAGIRRGVLKN